jgi:hypothetical protein
VETTRLFPPLVIENFSAALLNAIMPKLGDSCDTFERMWRRALELWHKLDANPKRKARCEQLKEQILELYERAKIKEKEREAEEDHKTQKFGYYVAHPQGLADDVLARLMFERKSGSYKHEFRNNNALQKTSRAKR